MKSCEKSLFDATATLSLTAQDGIQNSRFNSSGGAFRLTGGWGTLNAPLLLLQNDLATNDVLNILRRVP